MTSINEMNIDGVEERERQPLDIAKEIFTESDAYTKSSLTKNEITRMSRALMFAEMYHIDVIKTLIGNVLLLKRSEKGLALKKFAKMIESMKPEFQTKEGTGIQV